MLEKLVSEIIEHDYIPSVDEVMAMQSHYTTDQLRNAAHRVRLAKCGRMVDTCSIINARSGRCSENCKWCAQSRHFKTGIQEYDSVERDEALQQARHNAAKGVRRFSLVTSGRKVSSKDITHFCDIYRDIASQNGEKLYLCASMGLLDREQLQALKDAGVRRYHCNLETSSRFFPALCTTHTHADKLHTIALAREVGLAVCSGGIIGMGENLEDRVMLAAEARQAGAESIPVNILAPIEGTPLADMPAISDDEIMRSVALMRLVAPSTVMRFAGGRARLSTDVMEKILTGGMNGATIGDLLTTVGNDITKDYEMFDRLEMPH